MVVPTYPGVYINEFTPGAPIQGVGTSTAAFLGPCRSGPPNVPTRLTSWDAFKRLFGNDPVDNHYLWYAVRGYFENGGTDCYVTRVSNAKYDSLVLNDRTAAPGLPVITLRSRQIGVTDPALSVAVSDDNLLSGGKIYRPTAAGASGAQNIVTCANAGDAAKFRPGDKVTWAGIDAALDKPQVLRVENEKIRLASSLSKAYPGITVTLANLSADDTTFRMTVAAASGLPVAGQFVELVKGGSKASGTIGGVIIERVSPTGTTYRVTLREKLGTAFTLDADVTVASHEFRITVTEAGDPGQQTFEHLGMDPEHPNYYVRAINNSTGPIEALPAEPPNTTKAPDNLPKVFAATALSGGTADDPATLQATDYVNALAALEQLRDANQIVIPDRTDKQVQLAVVDHCARLKDRFAVLDSRRGAEPSGAGSVSEQLDGLKETKGYGALYYPWLLVPSAKGPDPILVPSSGHVAGIYSRTDNTRGVHKAPAGNEAGVSGSLGVERTMTDIDQGILNLNGVNVTRVFTPGARPIVWGARTTATALDSNWQYVNIRRLFIFLEGSLQEGLRWVVFEPNNQALWLKVKRTASDFLTRAWRDGALFGGTAEEAFYVRIDETLNPFSEQALGRLNIEIGVRPSYPAEFVIVNIGIWPGGSDISEG